MCRLNPGDKSSRGESPSPDTKQGEFEKVNILLDKGERSVNVWISASDLSSLKGVQPNHLYEHLNSSLGAVFTGKEKPGAVSAQEEAEQKGLVSRKRAVPEGGVPPEYTDYRQPPRDLEWPERFF